MGACFSSASSSRNLLENVDGNEDEYHQRYLEDTVLGQGEFGTVKLVHDVTRPASPALACKILRKGVVFKDNVLLSAIKPHVLRGEVEMLRELNGDCFCLKLIAIYESSRSLFMVTEYCAGGEMMEFTSALDQELRTEDVSRIAYQLLSAVDHCSKHAIIHRDIKPENCMFLDSSPSADIRLIDFGSGCLDKGKDADGSTVWHTTFAGSAFYISPEMFQHTYTDKTDVWSVGVTLYVLVSGYPADQLQKAFNILQSNKGRKLRELPNLPSDLPCSFIDLLEGMLTYKHKLRPSAGYLLQQEFVQFHKNFAKDSVLSIDEIAAAAAAANGLSQDGKDTVSNRSQRTQSIALSGTAAKHSLFLGFKRFERSLTTLLATILTKQELKKLLELLHERIEAKHSEVSALSTEPSPSSADEESVKGQTLLVVQVNELKSILQSNFDDSKILTTMEDLPFSAAYGHFAYHVALLSDFVELDVSPGRGLQNKRNSSFSYLRKSSNAGILTESAGSRVSVQSLLPLNKNQATIWKSERAVSRSLQGGNMFAKQAEGNKKTF